MPNDQDVLELYKQHQANQDKYTYFLLAAAGAAMGFGIQKTEGIKLSWWLLPMGVAILSWGGSFWFGCRRLLRVQATVFANYSLLLLRRGSHPHQPSHPELTAAAVAGVNDALYSHSIGTNMNGVWQFRMLIAGAASFIAWRVLEMVRVTYYS